MTEHHKDLPLTPGSVVLIAAFDDVPEHSFCVEEVFEDYVTGIALTGPLAGNTESQTSRSSCGCFRARNRTSQNRQLDLQGST